MPARRYAPDGRLDVTVHVPVSLPSNASFGGEGDTTLYIATGQAPDGVPAHDDDGSLFAVDVGVGGPLPYAFG